jgi:FAD synthase
MCKLFYLILGFSVLLVIYIKINVIESLVSSIEGKVIKGDQTSRKIDYPTANMNIETPMECGIFNGQSQYGKTTVISGGNNFVECHIHNFNKNIYGKKLRVDNIKKVNFNQSINCDLAKLLLK